MNEGEKMDVKKMDIKELKALAYDEGVKIEVAKQNLIFLNQEISKKMQEEKNIKK